MLRVESTDLEGNRFYRHQRVNYARGIYFRQPCDYLTDDGRFTVGLACLFLVCALRYVNASLEEPVLRLLVEEHAFSYIVCTQMFLVLTKPRDQRW